jgi:hypothetical protein
VYLDGPQPNLSLKVGLVASLLGRVEESKAQRQVEVKRTKIPWDRTAIGEFLGQDEKGRSWTIRGSRRRTAEGTEQRWPRGCGSIPRPDKLGRTPPVPSRDRIGSPQADIGNTHSILVCDSRSIRSIKRMARSYP